jgi:hypothetical protein
MLEFWYDLNDSLLADIGVDARILKLTLQKLDGEVWAAIIGGRIGRN